MEDHFSTGLYKNDMLVMVLTDDVHELNANASGPEAATI